MWPFKTTVKFVNSDGEIVRLQYAVSARDTLEAKHELERRLLSLEVFGYTIEDVVAVTRQEAASMSLPVGCVMMLA
jgi:hypothetical protein